MEKSVMSDDSAMLTIEVKVLFMVLLQMVSL